MLWALNERRNEMADAGKVEQLRDEVIGIRPVYSETGNATDLILKDWQGR